MKKTNKKCIYVMQTDNAVKIGMTGDIERRVNEIQLQKEVNIKDVYFTNKCLNAMFIERKTHERFSKNRITGEWFNVEFESAIDALDDIFNNHALGEEIYEKDIECVLKTNYEKRFVTKEEEERIEEIARKIVWGRYKQEEREKNKLDNMYLELDTSKIRDSKIFEEIKKYADSYKDLCGEDSDEYKESNEAYKELIMNGIDKSKKMLKDHFNLCMESVCHRPLEYYDIEYCKVLRYIEKRVCF